jgi:hypothetical protein
MVIGVTIPNSSLSKYERKSQSIADYGTNQSGQVFNPLPNTNAAVSDKDVAIAG